MYIALKRVRYGDVNIRLQNLNDIHLEKTVNRLFETISDRELMIKEYQSTLSKKNLSLEEILKQEKQMQTLKEDFTATLAHDMKVPVIAELNSINYLLDGRFGELNDKQSEVLKLMQTSNQELKDLIENMLEVYKIDEKGLQLNYTSQLINPFIQTVIKEMTPIAVKNQNTINVDLSLTDNASPDFDEFQLKRVIKNLIQNAISYSPSTSEITIKSEIQDNNISISISNKGAGISKEDLDLIFSKYYSGHSKFNKVGTGLGLYLSRQIMLAHKGNIKADCNKEHTTFTVVLPLNITC